MGAVQEKRRNKDVDAGAGDNAKEEHFQFCPRKSILSPPSPVTGATFLFIVSLVITWGPSAPRALAGEPVLQSDSVSFIGKRARWEDYVFPRPRSRFSAQE